MLAKLLTVYKDKNPFTDRNYRKKLKKLNQQRIIISYNSMNDSTQSILKS